jgi:hypothetical protein
MLAEAGATIFLNTQQPCIFWAFSFWASEVVVVRRMNRIRRDFRWVMVFFDLVFWFVYEFVV